MPSHNETVSVVFINIDTLIQLYINTNPVIYDGYTGDTAPTFFLGGERSDITLSPFIIGEPTYLGLRLKIYSNESLVNANESGLDIELYKPINFEWSESTLKIYLVQVEPTAQN